MTTLRLPDSVTVSGDALLAIAATLGITTTDIRVGAVGDSYDLKAGGWLYERPDDENAMSALDDRVLAAGVTGFALGTRWMGGPR